MVKHLKDYLAYWNLKDAPFSQSSSSVFLPKDWQAVLERILFFCERSSSLISMTTAAGHSKTTMARWLHQTLDSKSHEVLMFALYHEETRGGWLLPKLLQQLNHSGESGEDPLRVLGQALDKVGFENRSLTILIDDAHQLRHPDSLTDLHSLIGTQSLSATGLNIVLFGNASLNPVLRQSDSIANRISLTTAMNPLSVDQLHQYLKDHFKKTGLDPNIISFDALTPLHHHSGGIFSRLNTLMENCLIEAFLRQEKTIHSKTVQAAARFLPELDGPASGTEWSGSTKSDTSNPSPPKSFSGDSDDAAADEPSHSRSIELKSLFYKSGNRKNNKESAS
jgi:type II secretory pathway predicted ATPase ExeA